VNLLQLETDLRKALERSERLVHYQPIVHMETGRIASFEALVRWKHPEQGFVSPLEFIPVAEDSGLIQPIGEWVLREACRQLRAWKERFPAYPDLSMSVNVSGKQFAQSDLIEMIQETLDENHLDPRNLKLEITESTVVENVETAITMLKRLKAFGVESCIDDFGTGYSSLSYLHRFSASTLKVDRSFISRMGEQTENVEIVRSIVMLARNLEMKVVAEGIETEEQLVKLRALACEQGQGYFFSRPLDSAAATMLLESGHVFSLTKPRLSPALAR
jgi:EAL domain-containing protein (putative c-di-GMP-specific phosphodiesterase class I)